MPDDYPKLTFGWLVETDELVWIYCQSCLGEVEVLARAMPGNIPHDTLFPDIVPALECNRCGSKKVWARPAYNGGSLGEWARRWDQSQRALVVPYT